MKQFEQALNEIEAGNRRTLAKTLTFITESGLALDQALKEALIRRFFLKKTRPQIVGILGTPGSGKSTLINSLLNERSKRFAQATVGMLLIDPTSPVTGGALLGDRVRLHEHYLDEKVYIRSLSGLYDQTGVNPFLHFYLMVMGLFPFDLLLVESVGGGQAATNLKRFVDRLALVFDPNSGDGVQHLKSGVLDVADDIYVSKADLFPAAPVQQSLREWVSRDSTAINIWSSIETERTEFIADLFKNKAQQQDRLFTTFLHTEISIQINQDLDRAIQGLLDGAKTLDSKGLDQVLAKMERLQASIKSLLK